MNKKPTDKLKNSKVWWATIGVKYISISLLLINTAFNTTAYSTEPTPISVPQFENSENNENYGTTVSEWYAGENPPKLFLGNLKTVKGDYIFITQSTNGNNSKAFAVTFYDEDAEKEAIEIAKNYNNKENNIQLLGYFSKEDPNELEIIYGLSPNQIWKGLVSSNKQKIN